MTGGRAGSGARQMSIWCVTVFAFSVTFGLTAVSPAFAGVHDELALAKTRCQDARLRATIRRRLQAKAASDSYEIAIAGRKRYDKRPGELGEWSWDGSLLYTRSVSRAGDPRLGFSSTRGCPDFEVDPILTGYTTMAVPARSSRYAPAWGSDLAARPGAALTSERNGKLHLVVDCPGLSGGVDHNDLEIDRRRGCLIIRATCRSASSRLTMRVLDAQKVGNLWIPLHVKKEGSYLNHGKWGSWYEEWTASDLSVNVPDGLFTGLFKTGDIVQGDATWYRVGPKGELTPLPPPKAPTPIRPSSHRGAAMVLTAAGVLVIIAIVLRLRSLGRSA